MAYLDTSAPSTKLSTISSLVNTEDITLYFNKTSLIRRSNGLRFICFEE